ncbi:NAD(P)-dependent oxidoreductase [Petroclostridium sp. X23]|uniref:NAD(P)-dependent oxidoreductase n=1 Tax=Petroclostridium sp. X23 TaxID=3045146 RepID=UPI0024AD4E52|nr:NAD(P)-dependent oxidoreductase [Petroclostridium sp. X23]WHH58716.1 NAD(P)-dependent oxidoreductase [Petroclostridium sp. X23]
MKKVLVTYQFPKEGLKELYQHFDVTYPDKQMLNLDEVISVISEYDGLLTWGIKIDNKLLDVATKLRIVSSHGAGYDHIDVKCATDHGVAVANTPTAVTEATAELAFGLMLSLIRRIAEYDRKVRQDKTIKWGLMDNLGHILYGKTLGIIGMGKIGMAVARRAIASGMKVIYTNRNRLTEQIERSCGIIYAPMDELLKLSDVISVHTPLTAQTHHLIGEKEFCTMKPSAVIINTSRGPVLDESALISCLKRGEIAGAGLDVFEKEPIIPAELLHMDNVVLVPHIGTATIETRIDMAAEAAKNIIDYYNGNQASNILNPEVLEK